jgi:hypothetical protein
MKIPMKQITAGLGDTFSDIKVGDVLEISYAGRGAGRRYKVTYANTAKGLVGLESKSRLGAHLIQNIHNKDYLSVVVGTSSYQVSDIKK